MSCATFTKMKLDFLHIVQFSSVERFAGKKYNIRKSFLFLGEMRKELNV